MNTSQQGVKRLFWAGVGTAAIVLAGCASMYPGSGMSLSLSGANEVPPVSTSASGSGSFTVGMDKSVSGSVTTSGVAGTAAHIHIGAAGKNGPVAVPLTKTSDATWSAPAGAKFTDEQYQAYKAGDTYVNVHSAANKGGEIRAQLRP
jgi:CHRD domain